MVCIVVDADRSPGTSREETVELNKGELLATRYRNIRELLREKWLQLV